MKKYLLLLASLVLAGCLSDPAVEETTVVQQLDQATIDSLRAVGPDTVVIAADTSFVVNLDTVTIVRMDTVVQQVYDTTTMVFRDTIVVAADTVTIVRQDTIRIGTIDTVVVQGGNTGSTEGILVNLSGTQVNSLDGIPTNAKTIVGLAGPITDWYPIMDMPLLKNLEMELYNSGSGAGTTLTKMVPDVTVLKLHGGVKALRWKWLDSYTSNMPTLTTLQSMQGLNLDCLDLPGAPIGSQVAAAVAAMKPGGVIIFFSSGVFPDEMKNLTGVTAVQVRDPRGGTQGYDQNGFPLPGACW